MVQPSAVRDETGCQFHRVCGYTVEHGNLIANGQWSEEEAKSISHGASSEQLSWCRIVPAKLSMNE